MKTPFSPITHSLLLGALVAGLAGPLFPVRAARASPIRYILPHVRPAPHISIRNLAGSVTVRGWRQDALRITGTLRSRREHLSVQNRDGRIRIRVAYPEYAMNLAGSHLVVDIPAASRLAVKTVSADIDASRLTGTVRLRTVSGNVLLHSEAHRIAVKTVSGAIGLYGSAPLARTRIQSVSGGAAIREIQGRIRAMSVSGAIHLTGHLRVIRAALHTTSGDIRYTGPVFSSGRYVLTSVSGDIYFRTVAHPDARFRISTLSGSIVNTLGPRPRRADQYGPGWILDFVSGVPHAFVKIRSLSGGISLQKP